MVGFDVHASFDGPVDSAVPDTISEHLLAVVREAVTNIGRHAEASAATVSRQRGRRRMPPPDRGRRPGHGRTTRATAGLGLGNIGRRAEKLHGEFQVGSSAAGGTILVWQVPLELARAPCRLVEATWPTVPIGRLAHDVEADGRGSVVNRTPTGPDDPFATAGHHRNVNPRTSDQRARERD